MDIMSLHAQSLSHVQLFFDSIDCSSSVHGISQARILEWVVIPSPGIFLIQGLNSGLLHCRQFFTSDSPGKHHGTSPILYCHTKVEAVTNFVFLGSQNTEMVAVAMKWKNKTKHLLVGRSAMKKLGCILKSRDTILLVKVHIVKVMVFPVVNSHNKDVAVES